MARQRRVVSVSIALRIAKPPLPSPFNFLPSLTAFAHLPCPPFRRSTPEALDELNRSVEALRASPIDEDPGMAAMLRSVVLRVPDVESIAPDGRRCNLLAPDWDGDQEDEEEEGTGTGAGPAAPELATPTLLCVYSAEGTKRADDDAGTIPQMHARSWSEGYVEKFGWDGNVRIVEAAGFAGSLYMLGAARTWAARGLDGASNSGTREVATRRAVFLQAWRALWDPLLGAGNLQQGPGMNADTAGVFLVDSGGRVRWQGHGKARDGDLDAVRALAIEICAEEGG